MTTTPDTEYPYIDLDDDADVSAYADRPHLIEHQLEREMFDSLSDSEIWNYGTDDGEDYAYICGCIGSYASDISTRKALPELYRKRLINEDRCGENVERMIIAARRR